MSEILRPAEETSLHLSGLTDVSTSGRTSHLQYLETVRELYSQMVDPNPDPPLLTVSVATTIVLGKQHMDDTRSLVPS